MKNKSLNPFGTSRLVFEKVEGPEPRDIKHTSVLEDLDAAWESDAEKENKQLKNQIAAIEKRLDAMQASPQPKATNAPTTQASTGQSWFDKARNVAQSVPATTQAPSSKSKAGPGGIAATFPIMGAMPAGPSAKPSTSPTATEKKEPSQPPKSAPEAKENPDTRKAELSKNFLEGKNIDLDKLGTRFSVKLTDVSDGDFVKAVRDIQIKITSAVPTYQSDAKLQDGIFGAVTWKALTETGQDVAGLEKGTTEKPVAEAPKPAEAPNPTVPKQPEVAVDAVSGAAQGSAPPSAPEVEPVKAKEKINFNPTKFYEVSEDVNDLTASQRRGLKAYDVVYLPTGAEINPDGSITVKKSDGTTVEFHKDYLTHLGGKDWGVKQKEKFMADFYAKEAGVKKENVHFINNTTAELGGTISPITNRVVEVTNSDAGVGLSKVKLETGAEINVKTEDLEKVTDEAKINKYIIDRYQNKITQINLR